MKSQVKTESQKTAAKNGMTGSVALLALFRLSLLVGPETVVIKALSRSPVICLLAAAMVLGVWLSVDVWPFRAEIPKTAKVPALKPVAAIYPRSLSKVQGLNYLARQAVMALAALQSKLTV